MSRFWLVELEPDLPSHYTTETGVWCSIHQISGVKSITDLSAISQATLDVILLKPTEAVRAANPSTYDLIRKYWRRQRQPSLPLEQEVRP